MSFIRKAVVTVAATSVLILTVSQANAVEPELRTTLDDQQSVAVTIYNENLALVKDTRKIKLDKGQQQLAFRGVSARMRPETAMLRNTDNPSGLRILEQNFDFDLLTPQKMLEKYVGKTIRIARMNPATGAENIEDAIVLSTNGGTVVRIGDRIETNPGGRFIFDTVPANLRDEPTLSIQLQQNKSGTDDIELSYLTGGLSWKADYVAELNADESRLDLLGWVTLSNHSGASYNNATMQLVAGDVNQVQPTAKAMHPRAQSLAMAESADMGMVQESLFEYHLYTLGRPTTIADKQTKQVSLLTAASIKAEKELVLQGSNYYYRSSYGDLGQRMKPGVFVKFKNVEKNKLGVPLPKGVVRVYKRDSKGRAQFVGEDRVDHTAKNEQVRLKLGESFDVTANKKQTNFNKIRNNVYETSFEIELRNAKDEAVTVIVREPVPAEWRMIDESQKHTKVASGTAEWRVKVPAGGSKKLNYTTRVTY